MESENHPTIAVTLEEWGTALSKQLALYDRAAENAPPEARIEGYAVALGYVLNALKSYPGFDGGTVLLDELLLKLSDVTDGKPALHPIGRSGRAGHGWREAIIQGRSAAGVDFLIARGETEKAACEVVAKALTKAGVKGRRGGGISERTVRYWRSQADKFGENQDAFDLRENALRALNDHVPADGVSKWELRRFVAKLVSSGTAIEHSD